MADYDMNNGQCVDDVNGEYEDEQMDSETVDNPTTNDEDIENDDEDDRKLFIGGLNWHTKQDTLKKYCEGFGEVTQCDLKTNSTTGVSRCFAFVVFKDVESVTKFLKVEKHDLDNKIIDPKLANKEEDATKIFIGGLSTEATDEEIRSHFEQFGKITELSVPVDSEKKRKPYAFLVFSSRSAVTKATKEKMHTIHGKECEVKKSVPRGGTRGGRGFSNRGGRGNFGRGYGYSNYGYASNPYSGGYGGGYDFYGYGGYPSYGGYGGYGQDNWGRYDSNYGYNSYDQQSSFGKTRGRGGRGYRPY